VIWYAYDGDPQWGRLIDATGNLLPSGIAYGESYKWIVGATLTQPCTQDQSGTWTCSITRPGVPGGDTLELNRQLHYPC
jgi:hypothetical protein